ncbi:bis(5'-nucleosyl)-tetraphosphatase (symmetrical) YqeK [Tissierella carlieri]|uniref:bis(5'-nucleosyl)-tetraphosphatase (symmetrical) YqeK n=1 Tax=Tissierella carlieri TaxID=689904 RepID=UPI001C107D47|nr:bis(5'-nucleosyl)-tetraphosphatase (symmetrical) YqeK [Tissierella carlieri]MBU5311225.1 bis(5'-nucleosyl)-tetraphosphatase (symmetrical) YqeK [Tissierella carlieri]
MDKSLENKLIKSIGEKRYNHSIRVMETAIELAHTYNIDIEKIKTAAVLHDCAKIIDETYLLKRASDFDIILDACMEYNHELIHGPLGAKIAKEEYGIKDSEILDAIYYHTTGREKMSILDKIIYMADYIEPYRNFPGVEEVRRLAFDNLDKALLLAMEKTIIFLIERNKVIHPDTIRARNYLIIESRFDK